MNKQSIRDFGGGIGLSALVTLALLPCAAVAQLPSSGACNALVSLANNLYLVTPAGKVLTQFTSDGTSKADAALSPDGRKVAYVADNPNVVTTEFEVVNAYHQQSTYPIFQIPKRDDPAGFIANSSFQALSWSSDNVLNVETVAGKNGAFWLFRRVPYDLGPRAPLVVQPPMADDCALSHRAVGIACLDTSGAIYLDGGSVSGRRVFNISGFDGLKPLETFTLGVGESVNTQNTSPSYSVTVVSIDKRGVTLKITPPDGHWEQTFLTTGEFTENPDASYNPVGYGFSATPVGPRGSVVRIDVVKREAPWNIFDPALTWVPGGQGLLFIRRTDTQAFLYLIRPERGDQRRDERGRRHDQWTLAAQAVIDAPEQIDSMRFATPSLLLLKDDLGNYSEVPVQIDRKHGVGTLTLGAVTALPSTQNVELNGTATEGTVLDWSCEVPHGYERTGR